MNKDAMIYDLRAYVNTRLKTAAPKPDWGMSDTEKRANRYATAYMRYADKLLWLNSRPEVKGVTLGKHTLPEGWN